MYESKTFYFNHRKKRVKIFSLVLALKKFIKLTFFFENADMSNVKKENIFIKKNVKESLWSEIQGFQKLFSKELSNSVSKI